MTLYACASAVASRLYSATVRFPFDRNSTATIISTLRPTCSWLLHCCLNEETGQRNCG